MGHGCRALCLDLGGEGESLISHLTPQVSPRVYSPRNCLHASSIQIKVTIITRYNIIELLTMAYSYDLCRSLHSPFLRLYVLNIRSFNYFLFLRSEVTIITRYNIIELLTMAYSYDLCRSLHSPFLRLYVLNIRSFNYFLFLE